MTPRGVGLVSVGAVLAAFGLLFLLQGLGIVRWPASSFMIDQRIWVVIGAVMLLAGGFAMLRAFRTLR